MEHIEFDDNLFDERLAGGKVDSPVIQEAILRILQAVGENPERDGLKRMRNYFPVITLTRVQWLTMPSLKLNMMRWS
jgi:hypothetical protein